MSKQIVLGTLGYTIATFMLGATWHFGSGETGVRLCFLDNLQNPATGAEAKRTPHPSLSPQAGRGQR